MQLMWVWICTMSSLHTSFNCNFKLLILVSVFNSHAKGLEKGHGNAKCSSVGGNCPCPLWQQRLGCCRFHWPAWPLLWWAGHSIENPRDSRKFWCCSDVLFFLSVHRKLSIGVLTIWSMWSIIAIMSDLNHKVVTVTSRGKPPKMTSGLWKSM